MALDLNAVDAAELEPYVPVFGGEREKATADPEYPAARFFLRRMTEREAEAYQEFRLVDGKLEVNHADCARIFGAHVARAENFSLRLTGGSVVTIESGETFAGLRDQLPGGVKHLVAEVAMQIVRLSSLTERDAKN
jgi:hypothetical protein